MYAAVVLKLVDNIVQMLPETYILPSTWEFFLFVTIPIYKNFGGLLYVLSIYIHPFPPF